MDHPGNEVIALKEDNLQENQGIQIEIGEEDHMVMEVH